MEKHNITWRGIALKITFKPEEFGMVDHIEIMSEGRATLTEADLGGTIARSRRCARIRVWRALSAGWPDGGPTSTRKSPARGAGGERKTAPREGGAAHRS
jgi:hypothetical protein